MRPIVTALVAVAAWAVCGPAWGTSFTLDLRNRRAGGTRPRLAAAAQEADGALRSFALGAGVADVGEVVVGDALTVTLFDDVTVSLVLKEKMPSPLGGDVFLAEAAGYEGVKNAVVMRTADGLVMDVQDYLRKRIYKVISTAEGVTVQEIEAKGRGTCGCDTLKPPHSAGAAKSVRRLASGTGEKVGDTYVDILVAYERNAAAWVKSYGGGVTNFAQTAVQKMNTALANIDLDSSFRFRLVGVLEVSGSTRSLEYALDYATSGSRGWEAIKAKRDEVGADIATVLVDTGSAYGMTGLGWSLEDSNFDGFSESAFNACSIRAVAQDHTMTHEVGHNMGCGHSDVQETQPGPQLYSYSSGYYFSAGGAKFHTIMAYGGEGGGGSEVPYFSSPIHTYRGVAVGDRTHDNAKTLANTFAVAAGWRDSSAGAISGGDESEEEFFYDNDDFSSAKELSGTSGRISGSTVDAIGDIAEFLAQTYMSRHTVWYSWKAPFDGQLLVDVEKADFDTVMAAFSGSSSRSLTTLAYNDDKSNNDRLSAVSFNVKRDVTYHICVGGYQAERGDFRLSWEFKGFSMVFAAVAADCDGMGTVTGGDRSFMPGTKVTLKAMPSANNVFAGWTSDSTGIDWDLTRQNLVFIMPTNDVTVSARFVTAQEDAASLKLEVPDKATEADGTFALDLGACVTSISAPKLAVSGLPAGLKYDAKTKTIGGKVTKPGVYTVKVTATNAAVAGKDAVVRMFTITVPNLTCEALPNLKPAADAYGTAYCYVAFASDLVDCTPLDGWTVKATGLPSGLKYDAKEGVITGVPTKAGAFTVTFTATKKGEKSQMATITLAVANPTAVSESDPYNAAIAAQNNKARTIKDIPILDRAGKRLTGVLTVTIPAKGNISAKYICSTGTVSFSTKGWSAFDPASRELTATLTSRTKGYSMALAAYDDGSVAVDIVDPNFAEAVEGESTGKAWSKDDSAEEAKGYYTVALMSDGIAEVREGVAPRGDGYLTLKMDRASDWNAGKMTWAGMLPNGTSVSGSTILSRTGCETLLLPVFKRTATDELAVLLDVCSAVTKSGEIGSVWRHTDKASEELSYEVAFNAYGGLYIAANSLADAFETVYPGAEAPTLLFGIDGLLGRVAGGTPASVADVAVTITDPKISIGTDAANPQGVTMSFDRTKGIVKGAFNLPYTTESGATKTLKANYQGVVLTGWGADCGCGMDGSSELPALAFVNGAFYVSDNETVSVKDKNRNVMVKRGGHARIVD